MFWFQTIALFKCESVVQHSEASPCAWEPGKTTFYSSCSKCIRIILSVTKGKAAGPYRNDCQSQQNLHLQTINDQAQLSRNSVTQLPASSLVIFNYCQYHCFIFLKLISGYSYKTRKINVINKPCIMFIIIGTNT